MSDRPGSYFEANEGAGYELQMGRWSQRLAGSFIDYVSPVPDAQVLDVGCSTGSLAIELERHSSVDVTGVDYSATYAAYAACRGRRRVGTPALVEDDLRAYLQSMRDRRITGVDRDAAVALLRHWARFAMPPGRQDAIRLAERLAGASLVPRRLPAHRISRWVNDLSREEGQVPPLTASGLTEGEYEQLLCLLRTVRDGFSLGIPGLGDDGSYALARALLHALKV